jgi:hypothetical protein
MSEAAGPTTCGGRNIARSRFCGCWLHLIWFATSLVAEPWHWPALAAVAWDLYGLLGTVTAELTALRAQLHTMRSLAA